MILGFVLAGLGLLFRKMQPEMEMAQGFSWGSFICGLFILFAGIGYRNFCSTLFKSTSLKFENDSTKLINSEGERMGKVMTNYPRIQFVFIGIVLAALAVKFATSNGFHQGVAYAVIALFVGILIIEYFAKASIDRYYHALNKAIS